MADGEWLAPRRLNALPYEEQRDYIRTLVEASDSEESDHEQAVDQEDLEGNIDDIGGESSDAEQVQEIQYHLEDERDSDEEYEEPPLETGDYYTARDGNVWSSIPPIPGRIRAHNVLRSRNPGPVPSTNGLTMAETFNLMMSNEICDVIIRESNRKARQTFDAYNQQHPDAEPRIWVPITEVEFRAYLGVLLMAGVCHSGYVHTTDLWKTTSHPLFRASMSLRRFWAISRFIRFDNGNTRNARKQNDKAAAITDVFLMLNATLRKYYICGTNVTVDEQLYPYRGGTGFTQYIPSKPSKYGIKVWWVCDAISSYPVQIKNLTNLADTCQSIGKSATGAISTSYTSPSKLAVDLNNLQSQQHPQQQQTSAASSLSSSPAYAGVKLRKFSERSLTTSSPEGSGGGARSHSYRISMANLEETQESELDVILGELSLLEAQISTGDANFLPAAGAPGGMCTPSSTRTHSRTNSTISGATSISGSSEGGSSSTSHSLCSSSGVSENGSHSHNPSLQIVNGGPGHTTLREPRTESPDNDSAFSDTVSLLSSESSASSGMSSALHHKRMMGQQPCLPLTGQTKAAKIQLALHKLETAPVRRLFVKAFTADGASKSLLVDERMTCGHVTRLLADKNHVQMQPNWALVENLGDLQMERLFEDHELLVDNLMTWNSDAGNRVLFQQRSDKVSLFIRPELYLPGPQMAPGSQHDEHTRSMLLEEFFETNTEIQVDGPLYMKADSKKGWKRYHFVLRSSGLYYFPKEKTKNARDLCCLTLFNGYNVYRGLGWRKKWKAPSDYTFGFKSAIDSSLGKSCRTLKMLCAEDLETMEKWLTAIRVAKYGKQLWENQKALIEELTGDGMSQSSFAVSMRSESISSISSAVPSQCGSVSSAISSMSASSSGGRISRASSSSSSGCLSDDNNGFDSEFTTGTIKRKPSMKPNLPLTTMTRQLKEVGEITQADNDELNNSPEHSGTLTRRHSRRKSQESNGSGTLKRRPCTAGSMVMTGLVKRGSAESMNANNSSGSSNSTPTPTPSICAKPLVTQANYENQLPLPPPPAQVLNANAAGEMMCSSTLSLDSLPPPPPPQALTEVDHDVYGSQLSLVSLPPPPPPEEHAGMHHPQAMAAGQQTQQQIYALAAAHKVLPPAVPAKPIKPAVKSAPPYKNPPDYKGGNTMNTGNSQAPPPPVQKKVSFADSPVLLRRKMHSPEPTQHQEPFYAPGPLPPPRNDLTRLSNCSSNISSVSQQQDFGSPKRLQESNSNPPRDFLKDLQRVMRKKWQVAQKCKLEPATTPHEVLGFRDFSSEELLAHNLNSNSHYYRDTGNVSNWVQEHYGAGAPPPMNEYALYENVHATNAPSNVVVPMLEPQFPQLQMPTNSTSSTSANNAAAAAAALAAAANQRKKRPPPPPPKRSDSTHLTHRV